MTTTPMVANMVLLGVVVVLSFRRPPRRPLRYRSIVLGVAGCCAVAALEWFLAYLLAPPGAEVPRRLLLLPGGSLLAFAGLLVWEAVTLRRLRRTAALAGRREETRDR